MKTVWWHWMWMHMSNEMNWWKQCDGTAENVNEIMRTVWWHWMWIHMNNEMKWGKQCDDTECECIWMMIWNNDNSVMALLKMWMKNRTLWEQCDGNECEYMWVMKWSDENSVMALNVKAYE